MKNENKSTCFKIGVILIFLLIGVFLLKTKSKIIKIERLTRNLIAKIILFNLQFSSYI